MAQRFLVVNGGDSSDIHKKGSMIKTYSFTTDEDDAASAVNTQPKSDQDKVLPISSPSIDSLNNGDNVSKLISKLAKRKSRPKSDREDSSENKRPSAQVIPWYQKIDLLRPLLFVGILILLYLMWTQGDVFLDRLLTSSTRIRKPVITKKEQTIKESTDSSKTITTRSPKDSPPDSSDLEDTIENTEKISIENNNGGSISSPAKSSTSQKINIRLRRNKMSFSKEPQKKKPRHYSQDSSVDDNDDGVDGEEKDKTVEITEPILSQITHLTKKHHHRAIVEDEISESPLILESALNLSSDDGGTIEQLRKNLKARSRDRDFLTTLSKTIGLNKDKLHRFIYKKDNQVMTIQTFLSLLDSFNLMFLIVPK